MADRSFFQENSQFTPLGIPSSHSWEELGAITAIIEQNDIFLFIELGVHKGGLASLLAMRARYQDFEYLGVELYLDDIEPALVALVDETPRANLFYGDAFSAPVFEFIARKVELSRRTLVYCDNGNKPAEVDRYSKALKIGDLLLVHDYPREFSEKDIERTFLYRMSIAFLGRSRLVVFRRD